MQIKIACMLALAALLATPGCQSSPSTEKASEQEAALSESTTEWHTYRFRVQGHVDVDMDRGRQQIAETIERRLESLGYKNDEVRSRLDGERDVVVNVAAHRAALGPDQVRAVSRPADGLSAHAVDASAMRQILEAVELPKQSWTDDTGPSAPVVGHPQRDVLADALTPAVPDGHLIAFGRGRSFEGYPPEHRGDWRAFVLDEKPIFAGHEIEDARPDTAEMGPEEKLPLILIEVSDEAASRLAQFTRENTGSKMALVLGDEVVSAPLVQEEIPGGRLQLYTPEFGSFSGGEMPEAQREKLSDWVSRILSGALAPPVELVESPE